MPEPPRQRTKAISFPPFLLDLETGRLLRGKRTIALRPKVFAILCYLLERPGVLVSSEELFLAVWNGLAVTENAVTKTISELREALEDEPRRPRFIETVHRRGFRFIGPVRASSAEDRGREVEGAALPTIDAQSPPSLFLGRSAELRRLEEAFRDACLGERQVVFISGELGIGKTALVENFLRSDVVRRKRDVRVARGESLEHTGPCEAYLPVLSALGRLVRLMAPEDLVPRLRRCAPSWLAQMPWLLDPADAMALRQSLGDVRPERMLRELATYLEEITATEPLVLVLEDLHWSDPSTVDLLFMLAQRREPARLLVLATYRPADAAVRDHPLSQAKQTLLLRRQCREIALPYLSRAEVESYLALRFPVATFPEGLAALIHHQTDGNPLFVAGVVDELITRGWLVDTAPGWALTVPLERLHVEVADNLRDVIRSQFHAMVPVDQSLLEAAAVAGVEFTVEEISASLGAESDVVEAACERLVREQRFCRLAGIGEPAEADVARRYAFIHALYQSIVYAEIPEGRRRHLHQRIGEFLEKTYGDAPEHAATKLAHHFQRSSDYERAIGYLAAAAHTAEQRFAAREALGSLEAALDLLPHLKDAEERRRREIQLRLPLGSALNLVYGYASDAVRDNCERTLVLSEQGGNISEVFEAIYVLWYSRALRAEKDTLETAERLVELAERQAGAAFRMLAASALGRTAIYFGDHQKARDTLARCLADWERDPIEFGPATYGVHPAVAARHHYAYALHFLGLSDSAGSECRNALSFAESIDSPFTLTAANVHAALLHMFRRDRAEALRFSDRALALATEHGYPLWRSEAMAVRAWVEVESEGADAAIDQIRAAIALHDAGGTKLAKPLMLALVGECCLRAGLPEEGLAAVEEGLRLGRTSLDRFYLPELWRLKGELLLERGEAASSRRKARDQRKKTPPSARVVDSEPEACFEQALKTARSQHSKSLELRAAMSLGRSWESRDKASAARRLIEPIYASFTEGFETRDLREAKMLLRARGGFQKAAVPPLVGT